MSSAQRRSPYPLAHQNVAATLRSRTPHHIYQSPANFYGTMQPPIPNPPASHPPLPPAAPTGGPVLCHAYESASHSNLIFLAGSRPLSAHQTHPDFDSVGQCPSAQRYVPSTLASTSLAEHRRSFVARVSDLPTLHSAASPHPLIANHTGSSPTTTMHIVGSDAAASLMGSSSNESRNSSSAAQCCDGTHRFGCFGRRRSVSKRKFGDNGESLWFNDKTAVVYLILFLLAVLGSAFFHLFYKSSPYVYSENDLIPTPSAQFALELGHPLPEMVLPSRRIVYASLHLDHDTPLSLLFNLTSTAARFVLYARRTLPPTPTTYDYRRVVAAESLHSRGVIAHDASRRRRHVAVEADARAAFEEHRARNGLVAFNAKAGLWVFGFLNDQTAPLKLGVHPMAVGAEVELYGQNSGECLFDCFGKGTCRGGQCHCYPGYGGKFCQETTCPILCSGNGVFSYGYCVCHEGFRGALCEEPIAQCSSPDCNGRGLCDSATARCVCDRGWSGDSCEHRARDHRLDSPRSQRPEALSTEAGPNRRLVAAKSTERPAARDEQILPKQPDDVVSTAEPKARSSRPAETPLRSSTPKAAAPTPTQPADCAANCVNGECRDNKCHCDVGFSGPFCADVHCPEDCNRRGLCEADGRCSCASPWNGDSCQLEACRNNCNGRGKCAFGAAARQYQCACDSGFFGPNCEYAAETECSDGVDNDGDGLTDCEDSECCGRAECAENPLCVSDEQKFVIPKTTKEANENVEFFEKVKFLIGEDAPQRYANVEVFDKSRVAVVRGRVVSQRGGPLTGVRVSDASAPRAGFTLTRLRDRGRFDLLVNGGEFVRLSLLRPPLAAVERLFPIGANRIVDLGDILIDAQTNATELFGRPEEKCRSAHIAHSFGPKIDAETGKMWNLTEKADLNPITGEVRVKVPMDGKPLNVLYSTDRLATAHSALQLLLIPNNIPLPEGLQRVRLQIEVAGRREDVELVARVGLAHRFEWDRRDAYGAVVYGMAEATVRVGYIYEQCSSADGSANIIWRSQRLPLNGRPKMGGGELAPGYALFEHQYLDVDEGVLYSGAGERRSLRQLDSAAALRLRPLISAHSANNSSATLRSPHQILPLADGSVLIADGGHLYRWRRDAELTILLEAPADGDRQGIAALAADPNGDVYIANAVKFQIWRLRSMDRIRDPKANFRVVAGNGEECRQSADCGSNDGKASAAKLGHLGAVAIDPLNNGMFFADGRSIRHISRDGRLSTLLAANNWQWPDAECPAVFRLELLHLQKPQQLVVEPDTGDLIVLEASAIYRIDTKSATARLIAGRMPNCGGTQKDANGISVDSIQQIAVDSANNRLVALESDGKRVHSLKFIGLDAGSVEKSQFDISTQIATPTAMAVDARGRVLLADAVSAKIRIAESAAIPLLNETTQRYSVAESPQRSLEFDSNGRHLRTLETAANGETREFQFTYSPGGALRTVAVDSDNNTITIPAARIAQLSPNLFRMLEIDAADPKLQYIRSSERSVSLLPKFHAKTTARIRLDGEDRVEAVEWQGADLLRLDYPADGGRRPQRAHAGAQNLSVGRLSYSAQNRLRIRLNGQSRDV